MNGIHETILSPDERGRFPLRRYMPRPEPSRWMLFLEDDGKTIILKAVEE